jgi:hypothetical protein
VNLILNLKELWRHRLLAGAAVLAAAAIAVFAVYRVNLSPPSIAERSHVDAQGSIDILVDSANSPIADARRDLTGLIARAGVFARLIAGGNVVGQIARETDIPVKQIDVAGPTPLPGQAPGANESSAQIHPYGISITQQEELPILTVLTRAPTVAKARELAAAAPAAVARVVESIQQQQSTPAEKRVEFRVLGPAEAAPVDNSLGKKVALALFVVLLAIFVALILGGPRFVAAWRTADSDLPPPEPQHDPRGSPAVLVLPADDREKESGAHDAGDEPDRTSAGALIPPPRA